MIEIDHTALPPPEPARPTLASDLLAIEEKQRTRFSSRGGRIRVGCGEIDDYLLGGGCERGVVVGISAEGGEGRLISLHLLSTILLSQLRSSPELLADSGQQRPPKTRTTIIDTTGSFPVSLLAKILKSRIIGSRSKSARRAVETGNYVANEDAHMKGADEDVQICLEMVAISRVFDVEGLWEVLREVGRETKNPSESEKEAGEEALEEDGMEIIIIDNMTHIINELFARKERSEAHTLLTTLSRALHTLTHARNILTLLHNTTVSATSSSEASTLYPSAVRKKPPQNPQPTSIFPSTPQKPALGQIFTQFPDLHLLISRLLKTRADAEALYAEDVDEGFGSGERGRAAVRYCCVVEVLKDETPNLGPGREERRFGGREQRWAAVDVSADGLELVDAFMAKGNMRGLGLEREKRVQDMGNVAKIYGFGGQRV